MTHLRPHTLTDALNTDFRPHHLGETPGRVRRHTLALSQGCSLITLWTARVRQRRALGRLDPHLLADIGLTAEDVARECAKPFWKA